MRSTTRHACSVSFLLDTKLLKRSRQGLDKREIIKRVDYHAVHGKTETIHKLMMTTVRLL